MTYWSKTYVICGAAGCEQNAFHPPNNSARALEQMGLKLWRDKRLSTFRAGHNVIERSKMLSPLANSLMLGVGFIFLAPLRGATMFSLTWGVA